MDVFNSITVNKISNVASIPGIEILNAIINTRLSVNFQNTKNPPIRTTLNPKILHQS